jgi:hypothetical protein
MLRWVPVEKQGRFRFIIEFLGSPGVLRVRDLDGGWETQDKREVKKWQELIVNLLIACEVNDIF